MHYSRIVLLLLTFALGNAGTSFCQMHLDSLLTNPYFLAGDSLQQAGHYQLAIAELETAADHYQEAERWPDYFYTENKICENLWRLGQYDTARQVAQSMRTQSVRQLGAQHPVGLYNHFNIGFLHHMYGRYEEAVTSYHTGLSLASRHPTAYPLLRDDLYHAASISYLSLGQYDSAMVYCRQGLRIRSQQGKTGQAEIAKSYAQLGAVHSHLGNQDSSLCITSGRWKRS